MSVDPFARLRSPRAVRSAYVVLLAAYVMFVFEPIVARLLGGSGFGADPTEYLLAAQQGPLNGGAPFHYPFPLLPLLYIPLGSIGLSFPTLYITADLLSGGVMVALFASAGALGYAIGRTPVAAGASALAVGTFSLLVSEVGWGGQAQLLSFTLGALAIATVFGVRTPVPPPRARWVAGGLLGAAVLAEAYSGAFFVVFALVASVLLEPRPPSGRRLATGALALTVFPGAAYALTWFAGGAAIYAGASAPVLPYALRPSGWATAFAENGFGSPVNMYGYLALVGALLVFLVWGRPLVRRETAGIVSASVACAVQVLFVTPAVYWDRAPFFVVFPVAVVCAILASELPRGWGSGHHTETGRAAAQPFRRGTGSRWGRAVRIGVAVVAIGVLIGQSAVAEELYPPALAYYGEPLAGLSSLTWLRAESGGALVVAPPGEVFPIAYATERPEYPAVQPYWFDTASERAAASLANTLVTGTTWLAGGALAVVQAGAPLSASSPSLLSYRAPYVVALGSLFEEQGGEFAQAPPPVPAPSVATPAPPSSSEGLPGPDLVSSDRLPAYDVATTAWFTANGTVDLNLTFVATGVRLPSVGVGLDFEEASLRSFATHGAVTSVSLSFAQPGTVGVRYALNVTVTADASVVVGAPAEANRSGNLTLTWNATPVFGFTGSQFNVSMTIGVAGYAPSLPALITEAEALAGHGLRWLIVSTSAPSRVRARFADDSAFSLVRTSDGFSVYRVE